MLDVLNNLTLEEVYYIVGILASLSALFGGIVYIVVILKNNIRSKKHKYLDNMHKEMKNAGVPLEGEFFKNAVVLQGARKCNKTMDEKALDYLKSLLESRLDRDDSPIIISKYIDILQDNGWFEVTKIYDDIGHTGRITSDGYRAIDKV